MSTLILLLTDNFPYGTGEEFLESEIPFLSKAADDVIIVPVRATSPARQTRSLPGNVRTFLPEPSPTKTRTAKLGQLVRTLRSLELWRGILTSISPRNIGANILFSMKFLEAYDRVSLAVQEVDFRKYDSVVVYSYWFASGVGIGRQLIKNELSGIKSTLIARGHRYDIDAASAWRGYLPSREYFLQVSDHVYAISHHAKDLIQDFAPGLGDKVEVRRLGVSDAESTMRKKPSTTHFVTCSAIVPVKRLPLLVEALSILETDGVDFEWTHLGGADEQLTELKSLTQEKLRKSRTTLTGHKSNSEVLNYLDSTEISFFVNVSSSEGVPVTIMEAQARAIPVIATSAGGTGELVKDGVNGRLLPLHISPQDLANEIRSTLSLSETEYSSWSEASLASWQAKSNAQTQYRDFANELRTILHT